jgi:hypothetical protein
MEIMATKQGSEQRKEDRRSGKDRRVNLPRDYNGPEKRKGARRSGGDRRKR